ncbi:zinc ribbon domain-containing protein [Montanilutibacter psychrotolerans]|uniref:Zinc ribbon domain-containing protein n=1 Tax=Montanilutibacter psychrotolerans TaxID=1327343 RepID=A0A3M8SV74_9GAMM|nr:zinc ribbon domain-containing protein [Lysobacter psychrotolerans]RNF85241.1 zinc ribbon domain-containing protein [Lysobacter psychrotolerans]
MDQATVAKHACPECGADLQWNPTRQSLACPYCGTVVPAAAAPPAVGDGSTTPPVAGDEVVEQDLLQALREPPGGRGWGEQRREVQCQSCQAISVFVGDRVAQRCDFCGSPSILAHEQQRDAITPQSVLPFVIDEGRVRESIRAWYGNRWFAPNRLKHAALTDTLKGVYLPYWTFDAQASADWTAEAGHYYYTNESYRDGNGRTQSRRKRHVRWEPAAGHVEHFFDDALVAGTVGVHPQLLRQVEPFPTATDLRPYSPEFVRGWTVERYQVDLHKASQINMDDMQASLRSRCAQAVPGDTQRNLEVDAQYHGRTFKHVLVPVWLVSYTYGSRTFQVLANGHTGALAGERPYSWIKIALAILAVVMALLVMLVLSGGDA